jgi:hypothetical protein
MTACGIFWLFVSHYALIALEVAMTAMIIPFPDKRERQRRGSVNWAPELQTMMRLEVQRHGLMTTEKDSIAIGDVSSPAGNERTSQDLRWVWTPPVA